MLSFLQACHDLIQDCRTGNRLRRAGVPREAAMRLVNHSSELIHQIYQREKVEDVAQWRDAVQFPSYSVSLSR